MLMESLAGTGHAFAAKRLRVADKLELFRLDPLGTTMFSALSVHFLLFWFVLFIILMQSRNLLVQNDGFKLIYTPVSQIEQMPRYFYHNFNSSRDVIL